MLTEWRDLQARCGQAVAGASAIDLSGLEERAPTLTYNRRLTDGTRRYIGQGVARVGTTAPRGVWGRPGGSLELRVIEMKTRPGTRTICEIIPRRGGPGLTAAQMELLRDAYGDMRDRAVATGAWTAVTLRSDDRTRRMGMELHQPNARECSVIASLTVEPATGYFRSAVSEKADVPTCGGPSLLTAQNRQGSATRDPRTQGATAG
ncbi:hypothetical protein JANAI62_32880 [Jannaschia pagri]|uniref:Uncharacterized protein n=2 Tax=Roseobacteraceae TaxID=2854170 RepID=A0ABQ4NQH6_9RHOB|nr:hypothetical protein JANAI61_32880 [Jannaschia sp. AI_61]GIT96665.1 hypothetical protein JANAI62_32880 [Jannaschia sp. AI_62]